MYIYICIYIYIYIYIYREREIEREIVYIQYNIYNIYIYINIFYSQVNSDWQQLIEDAKQRRLVVKVNSALDSRRVICENCKK